MVTPENCTAITEILLVGFKPFQGFRTPLFVLFLIIYMIICWENLLIIYIIWSSARLKVPMFFIIQSLCICDLVGITNIVPKFINDVIRYQPTITITGCIIQLQVFGTYGDIASFHYVLMSYDRYLAVCHPLRYSSFVNNNIYFQSIIIFWVISAACSGVQCFLVSLLQFCGLNSLQQFFCDYYPFLDLATSDTTNIRVLTFIISALIILTTISSVFVSYVFIIRAILKIPSASGRKKTFSTCSSHLIVFSMQYSLSFGAYLLPNKAVALLLANTFTHFFWNPMMGPLIYSFNNKEFRAEFRKRMKKMGRTF